MAKKLAVIVGLTLCLVGMRAFEAGDRGAVRREAASAWTKLGPVGGDIAGLAASSVTPGELYAVSSLGLVFRSTTNGASVSRCSVV